MLVGEVLRQIAHKLHSLLRFNLARAVIDHRLIGKVLLIREGDEFMRSVTSSSPTGTPMLTASSGERPE